MSPKLKKILIIVGFIAVILILGFIIYFTFFRVPAEQPVIIPTEEPPTTGGLPLAGEATARPEVKGDAIGVFGERITGGLLSADDLTAISANNITLSATGNSVQYYDADSGLFYSVDKNGNTNTLTNKKFYNVKNVTWSGDKNKAVLEYPDGSNIIYNFKTKQQTTLPKHWEDFNFSPDGEKLISKSISDDVDARWLISSNVDGTNTKVITALGENADKVQVAWSPNNQVVAFSSTGDPTSSLGTEEIYLLGQNNENFKSLKVQGFNFQAKWAQEGDRLLYNVTDPGTDFKPVLWITDASGDNIGTNAVKVNLNTWVDKCTVVSNYRAYCAVPKILDSGAGLEPRAAYESDDIIYAVNLKTGAVNFIGEPDTDYSISQVSVSEKEDYIFFTDRATGTLHKMKVQ